MAIPCEDNGDNVANSAQTPEIARATEFVKGIGENLETIQGRDMILRSFHLSERPMRGEKKPFVSMELSEIGSEEVREYHAWSESLRDKLAEIPDDKLPLLVQFVRVSTSGGFRVWSFI